MIRPLLSVICACVTFAGCPQPERLSGSSPIDPRRSTPEVLLEPISLTPMVLDTHADYDEWERMILDRSGPNLAFLLYKEALTRKRGNRRTFVRWLLLSYREKLPKEYRQMLQSFTKSLANAKELTADIRYLLGYMAWRTLVGTDDSGTDHPVNISNGALVDTVQKNWGILIKEFPNWVGPYGITTDDVAKKMDALTPALKLPTRSTKITNTKISKKKAEEFSNAFEAFYRHYEDLGSKKACQRVDAAIQIENDPSMLADAYAHCALDRGNPTSAATQVDRMLEKRIHGGIPALMERLRGAASENDELNGTIVKLTQKIREIVKDDPAYASNVGITLWLKSNPVE